MAMLLDPAKSKIEANLVATLQSRTFMVAWLRADGAVEYMEGPLALPYATLLASIVQAELMKKLLIPQPPAPPAPKIEKT